MSGALRVDSSMSVFRVWMSSVSDVLLQVS